MWSFKMWRFLNYNYMSNTYCSTHHEITAPPGLIELAPGYPSINIVTPQLERKDFCSLLSNTDHTCTYMLCKPHVCVCIYRHEQSHTRTAAWHTPAYMRLWPLTSSSLTSIQICPAQLLCISALGSHILSFDLNSFRVLINWSTGKTVSVFWHDRNAKHK